MAGTFETGLSPRYRSSYSMLNADLVVFMLTLYKAIKTCKLELSYVRTGLTDGNNR